MPPGVTSGTPDVQPPGLVVANSSSSPGVVAYDTTGWPTDSDNGPAAKALGHTHVPGPVVRSVIPPVGRDHNAVWANCGVYDEPLPNERAVHNLEHGAVWITPTSLAFRPRRFPSWWPSPDGKASSPTPARAMST
jgi:hypothetical protein